MWHGADSHSEQGVIVLTDRKAVPTSVKVFYKAYIEPGSKKELFMGLLLDSKLCNNNPNLITFVAYGPSISYMFREKRFGPDKAVLNIIRTKK